MTSTSWIGGGIASVMLVLSSVASAQQLTCRAGDADCRGAAIIIGVLNQKPREQGIREFAIGTVCKDDELIKLGRGNYDKSIDGVVTEARQAVRDQLSQLPSGAVDKVVAATDFTVRSARNAQVSGMIAGLESAFGLFPRSRAEYCAKLVPQLKSATGS